MSFGAIADDYDRLRPAPPAAAVDWLLPERCEVAVDLAAGTGLLSRALARRVARVVAVEPDGRMAAVLRARSGGAGGIRPGRIHVVLGRGETIPMPDASADGVFVSSAWHWMDSERATREVARVLRDGGRFGLIWTGRDRREPWVAEFDSLVRPRGPDAEGDAGRRFRPSEVVPPSSAPLENVSTASFAFRRPMTIGDVVAMLATYSGVITASPEDRAAGLARARAALEQRFPGADTIDVPMGARCWRADRARRAAP